MKTVIIGSGNVAWHLSKAFTGAGIELIQVFGRNKKALEAIHEETGVPVSTQELASADFYLICTSDKAIGEVSRIIPYENVLVAHTAGSLSRDILEGSYRKASLYPLQTFSKDRPMDYAQIPFLVDASWEQDNLLLTDLMHKISKNVIQINHLQRKEIHLAAVFACNFVNHLYARAKQICDQNNVPFDYLLPLIKETAEKVTYLSPKEAQTGPAIRKDENVIQFQEGLLENPEMLKIYKTMTQSIIKFHDL